jgi:hypothetical protein
MPTYNFRNLETGEETEVILRISELDQYKEDNPHLQQFLTRAPGGVGMVRDMYSRVPDGFNDVVKQIKKGSGMRNTIKTK